MSEEADENTRVDPTEEGVLPDLVVIDDDFGAVLLGSEEAIESFTDDWGVSAAPVHAHGSSALDELKRTAFGKGAVHTAYLVGAKTNDLYARRTSGALVTYHKMVRNSDTGKIVSHSRIPNPTQAAMSIGPQVAALAALEAAISAQFDQINARLDVIEDKIDEILRLASAEQIGDVYGKHRRLVRLNQEIGSGRTLTNTDWSSIATIGAELETGVERLRVHAFKQVQALNPSTAAPAKRVEKLEQLLREQRFKETLQLLVVAQKSLFLWQRLRLERVRHDEPQHFEQTLDSARETLQEHYDADLKLLTAIRQSLDAYTVLSLTEAHHKLAGRKLTKLRPEFLRIIEEFERARNLQLADWTAASNAGIRDAISAARDAASRSITSGRRRLAAAIQPKDDETSEKRDTDEP